MGIKYFYNIYLKDTGETDLSADILSDVRKSFFSAQKKQKGKFSKDSGSNATFYSYKLEKNKMFKWSVTDSEKNIIEEAKPLDQDRYCICVYQNKALFKKLVFSKLHTLLRVEYFDYANGYIEPYCTLEPRRASSGLCILMTSDKFDKPIVLYTMPDVYDEYVKSKVESDFTDYYAVASTDEGLVRFLSNEQVLKFSDFIKKCEKNKSEDLAPISYINSNEAMLAEKLNPKDFNIKRNLSEIIDITQAQQFSDSSADDIKDTVNEEDAVLENINRTEEIVNTDISKTEKAKDANGDSINIDTIMNREVFDDIDEGIKSYIKSIMMQASNLGKNDSGEKENLGNVSIDTDVKGVDSTISTANVVNADINETSLYGNSDIENYCLKDENFEKSPLYDTPDKLITSHDSKYFYYGNLDENFCRSGFGRTATTDGKTVYEGYYKNNRRSGFGAYYYKDGGLCYAGEWKDNKRFGVGVGISSADKSIHIGNWSDNKPSGNGARFDRNGDILFVKKELSNNSTLLINFMADDFFVVSKYDKDGNKLNERILNVNDLFNLL